MKGADGRTHVEVDPEEAALYRRLVDMVLVQGLSMTKVCLLLNEAGTPTRRVRSKEGKIHRWNSATLRNILHSPAHKGEIILFRHRVRKQWGAGQTPKTQGKVILRSIYEKRPEEKWVRIKIPSLISEKEWNALQERITKSRSDGAHYLQPDRKEDLYLLRGLAACGVCGARMQPYDGMAKGSRYYACFWKRPSNAKHRGRQPCPSPWMPARIVEEPAKRLLAWVLTMPNEVVRRYGELTSGKAHRQNLGKRLAEARREQKQVKEEFYRMIHSDIAKRGYPTDILSEVLAERKERLAYLEEVIADKQAALEAITTIADGLEQLQHDLEMVWLLEEGRHLGEWLDRATVEQQRVLLRALYRTRFPGQREREHRERVPTRPTG